MDRAQLRAIATRCRLRQIASSRSRELYNRAADKVELPPARVRIGDRDPMTGKDEVIYPDGGKEIVGRRLFNSSVPSGAILSASRAPNSSVVTLDGKNFKEEEAPPTTEVKKQPVLETDLGWYLETWATQVHNTPIEKLPSFSMFYIQSMGTAQKPEFVRQYTYSAYLFPYNIKSTVLEFRYKDGSIKTNYNFFSSTYQMPFVYSKLLSGVPTVSNETEITSWRLIRAKPDYWLAKPNYAPAPSS